MKEGQINLLKVGRKISGEKAELVRKIKVASFLLLIVYCVLLAGALSFWLIFRKQSEQISKKIEFQEQRIKDLEKVETLHTFLKQRLSSLTPLLTQETMDYETVLGQLESFVSEGVVLNKLELSREGQLNFGGMAANAVAFADFLERLLANEELAENIKLSSTSRQEDGSYSFNLFLDVKI
jgi:hypothetical protein